MHSSRWTLWKRKARLVIEFDGEVIYFWFCVLISSLMGISQAIWGDPSPPLDAVFP